MDTTIDQATLDIACSLSAAERAERGEDFTHLFADAEEVVELAGGYALKFPNRDAWITRAVELIVAERKCCPFFRFTLVFEPNGGAVWAHLEGPAGVKDMVREMIRPAVRAITSS